MTRILVSHPHAVTNANETAAALDGAGLLAGYVVGVGAAPGTVSAALLRWCARFRPQLENRIVAGVGKERLVSLAAVEAATRLGSPGLRRVGFGPSTYDALFVGHDAAVAALPWPRQASGVYAYEDGAYLSFRRAARRGLSRIWDLPIPHYRTLERMWRSEAVQWPGAMGAKPRIEPDWKKRRKDGELALATAVSVASEFTRQSLSDAALRVPVMVVPYGFPVDQFVPRRETPRGRFTVLAVGTQNLRKGTPYLLEAWKRAGIKAARLRLVGPMRLTSAFLEPYRGLYEHVPHVPRVHLGDEYRAADLLAFPTLGDGFGLVIQEAMCCGTPVATTRCGGGPECITSGQDGWILPERSIDAWVEFLRFAAANRDLLHGAGAAARKRAESYPWREARCLLAEKIAALGAS